MALSTEDKKAVLAEYGIHETDTGSPEAQIAMLTALSVNYFRKIKPVCYHFRQYPLIRHCIQLLPQTNMVSLPWMQESIVTLLRRRSAKPV